MEAGETPQEGIAREILEETNLSVSALNLIGVYDFQRMNQVIIAYHAVASGEVRLSPELADTCGCCNASSTVASRKPSLLPQS
jgi:NAD+ diphosphatase